MARRSVPATSWRATASRRSAPGCGSIGRVLVTPTSRAALAEEVVELVAARPGRVRLVLDGPAPARPGELAAEVATALRARGRPTVVVDAADFLRPASVRLEPAAPDGSGQVLPRLWNTRTDRAYRDGYTALPADGVVVLHGALLLGRGLPAELAVHFRMSAAALTRTLGEDLRWTVPAHVRHEQGAEADLLVLADHPDRPAVQRTP